MHVEHGSKDDCLKGLHVARLYMSKRDSTSNRKAFFHKLSCLKASSLRWKDQVYDERQYQLQETIQGPGLSARLPTQGLKHQGVLGWRQLSSETSEVINGGHTSQTEIHFKEYSSTTCAVCIKCVRRVFHLES